MKERTKRLSFITAALIPALLVSCSRNNIFSDTSVFPGKKWDLSNVLSFNPNISDTANSNNILFVIRTGSSYPYRNIFLFVSTKSPEGKTLTDTVEYALADAKGNRYGRGFGEIRELSLPFRSNVYFPRKGIYSFTVRHGMRAGVLDGIYDFGLRIERISK
jgi:gliding motility-associated lipoprotein GldH